jgi:hypothetical protein
MPARPSLGGLTSTAVGAALGAPLCLLTRFFQAMGQHVLRVRQAPAVRQKAFQRFRTRVDRELQDHVTHIRSRLKPVPFRPRQNRAQHRGTRARGVIPQE